MIKRFCDECGIELVEGKKSKKKVKMKNGIEAAIRVDISFVGTNTGDTFDICWDCALSEVSSI